MNVLRTPDSAFSALPDFPWSPSYVDDLPGTTGIRMAYIDEGPRDAAHTFLCLHGQPTWSYLYRKMIPPFLASGGRVVAPDLIGFGRSDKPDDDAFYTFDMHRDALVALIERLDLRRITLVVQDWGGILGLTLPLDMASRFDRLLVMNTAFGVGTPPSQGFTAWRAYVARTPDLPVGGLLARSATGLSEAEAAAYDAPFPDVQYKAGVRAFPQIVPTARDAPGAELSREAASWWSTEWAGPTFMAVGAQDPVLGPSVMASVRRTIRGCPEPLVLEDVGHFVQESGDVVAAAALAAFGGS